MNNINYLYQKNITLEQAIAGGNFKIQTENGQTIKVKLKPGSFNGQVIRLKGSENTDSNKQNDTFIELKVLDHPLYSVDGLNLNALLVITPADAEVGCVKNFPGPNGKPVKARVNPKSKEGQEVVVKGAGLSDKENTGDIIYKIRIDFLDDLDEVTLMNDLSDVENIYN